MDLRLLRGNQTFYRKIKDINVIYIYQGKLVELLIKILKFDACESLMVGRFSLTTSSTVIP